MARRQSKKVEAAKKESGRTDGLPNHVQQHTEEPHTVAPKPPKGNPPAASVSSLKGLLGVLFKWHSRKIDEDEVRALLVKELSTYESNEALFRAVEDLRDLSAGLGSRAKRLAEYTLPEVRNEIKAEREKG